MPVENVKPFLPSHRSGPVFIGLNILRFLSIVALLLVFSSNIVTMVDDIKAIRANQQAPEDEDCDYYEYSTVPDQAGGPFWSILNRLFIIFECILLVLSEVGMPRRFFEEFVPVLGPAHSLGCLGVFEALIGAQVLSHYCEKFPQVSAWLLFIIGCLNLVAGLVFRQKGKERRLIFSWENVSSLTPQTRMAATAWDMVTEKRRAPQHDTAPSRAPSHKINNSAAFGVGLADVPLRRSETQHANAPLIPQNKASEPSRFSFGFGKKGESAAADRGWKISRPMESLPRYAIWSRWALQRLAV